jgi:hypothetical protein
MIAQLASSRVWALTLVADQYNLVALEFVAALAQIFPRAGSATLHHAYQFMLSSTLYAFSDNQRLESLSHGALRSSDFSALAHSLQAFVVAGIVATCQARKLDAAISGKQRRASR